MNILIYIIIIVNLSSLVLLRKSHHHKFRQAIISDGATCNRQCVRNQTKICYFELEIEDDHTMSTDCGNCPLNITDCFNEFCLSADGVPRTVTIINKQLPGPLIRVCQGDRIVVDVRNRLGSDTSTIHWHGILQQGTQYNDGVPYVTQCPILPGDTFRYHFHADEAGTFFYHSHSGLQRTDGVTAPLVIDQPDADNPLRNSYDYDLDEHIILYFDWDHELALSKYEGVIHWINGTNTPNSMLVNGLGMNRTYGNQNNPRVYTPTARFHVKKGYRYRFRLINSGNLDCPILVSIDKHNMTVISSDGNFFKSVEVDSIMTLAGERYDFILNANQTGGVFWIKFQGVIQCGPEYNGVRQVAVLQYDNIKDNNTYPTVEKPSYQSTNRSGLQLNPLNDPSNLTTSITLPELQALTPVENELKGTPTFVYYVSFDLRYIYNPVFRRDDYPTPQINNISNMNLPFPLLSQRYSLNDSMLCNETTVSNCDKNFCQCSYVVKIPLNAIVEFVLINLGAGGEVNHPFHLHGFKFRVVSFERIGITTTVEQVKKLYNAGQIKRNLVNAPEKDTVNTPAGGYTLIRFKASNPGFWLFHCHIDHHVEEGMSMVFQVGKHADMPVIPINFPTCGDYKPVILI